MAGDKARKLAKKLAKLAATQKSSEQIRLQPIPTHGVKILKNSNAKRRYGHFQGNRALPGYHPNQDDLLNLFKTDKTYLYGVKEVGIQWAKTGPGNTGARSFKYDRLDPLVYWNPDVVFQTKKIYKGDPALSITRQDGQTESIGVKGKKADDIFQILLSKVNYVMPRSDPARLEKFIEYWESRLHELPQATKVILEIEKERLEAENARIEEQKRQIKLQQEAQKTEKTQAVSTGPIIRPRFKPAVRM